MRQSIDSQIPQTLDLSRVGVVSASPRLLLVLLIPNVDDGAGRSTVAVVLVPEDGVIQRGVSAGETNFLLFQEAAVIFVSELHVETVAFSDENCVECSRFVIVAKFGLKISTDDLV